MNTTQIKLYDLFRKRFNMPDTQAIEFVEAIEDLLKTPEFKSTFKDDFQHLDNRITQLDNKVTKDVNNTKVEIIKWMVGLFIAFFVAIVAFVLALLTFMVK